MASRNLLRRRRTVPLVVAVVLGLLMTTGGSTAQAETSDSAVGISMPGTKLLFTSDAKRESALDDLAQTGSEWLRISLVPSHVTWTAGEFDWRPLDKVVRGAKERNLKVLVAVSQLPSYARPEGSPSGYGPKTDAERESFANFASVAASRYDGSVQAWEVWPEANKAGQWVPAPDATNYTKLLKATYAKIKAADPSATVVTGGFNGLGGAGDVESTAFAESAYRAGAQGSFDALGIYGFTAPEDNTLGELQKFPEFRRIMDRYGDSGKKIWVTATGTSVISAPESVAADNVEKIMSLAAQQPGAGPVFFYTLMDDADIRGLGLIREDGSKRPAYEALVLASAKNSANKPSTPRPEEKKPDKPTVTEPSVKPDSTKPTTAPSPAKPVVNKTGDRLGEGLGIAVPATTLLWSSTQERNRELDRIAASGAEWMRLDVYMDQLTWVDESQIDWPVLDRTVDAARARGLKIDGLLGTLPKYARPAGSTNIHGPTTARERQVFANFAKKAAARYQGRIDTWEVWNEPNLDQYWSPTPRAADYAALLSQTRSAIKDGNPGAKVLTGGTGGKGSPADVEPSEWIRQVYRVADKRSFDAVAIHAYTAPHNGNLGEFVRLPDYRKILDDNGDGEKELWITEAGTQIGLSAQATEQISAEYLPKAVQAWQETHHHGPMMFFTLRDQDAPGFGFFRTDGTVHPHYKALQTVAAQKG